MALPSGVLHRWRADDLTAAAGTTISTWAASAGGTSLTQSTSSAQPVFRTDGLNGHSYVDFLGGDSMVSPAAWTGPGTIMIIARYAPGDTTERIIIDGDPGSAVADRVFIGLNRSTATGGSLRTRLYAGTSVTGAYVTSTDEVVVTASHGSAGQSYINGDPSVASSSTGIGNPNGITLGADNAGGRTFVGRIYEVLIFDHILTGGERADAHTYVQDTYGIAVSDYVTPPIEPTNRTVSADAAGSGTLSATSSGTGDALEPPPSPTDGLVAFWDFSQPSAPFTTKQGVATFPLQQGSGSTITKVNDGPLGHAIELDGTSDYLIIPAAEVGALDAAQAGDSVTVAAWVKRTDANQGYIAGLWNEGQELRNYGLFLDLDTYGGNNNVCGHISNDGGPTTGYPYSRDYSANARQLRTDGTETWRFVTMTYDGAEIRSYLDGQMDSRPSYTDNLGNTYPKNPYPYTLGLNHIDDPCDFTVGGNLVGSTIQNLIAGRIGGIWIYNRALSPDEVVDLQRSTLAAAEPAIKFDFWFPSTGAALASTQGWRSARGATATDTDLDTRNGNFLITELSGQHFLYRSNSDAANTTTEGVGYYPTFAGLNLSELSQVSFRLNNSSTSDTVRFIVRVGSTWYASEQTFNSTVAASSGGNWGTAETKTFTPSLASGAWRALTFVEGSSLALGATINAPITDGEVTAVGFYNPGCSGVVRIDDLAIIPTAYAAPQPSVEVAAALTGSGTLTAQASRLTAVSAAASGSGTLTATSSSSRAISAAASGSGTLTASSAPRTAVTATATGSGMLTAALSTSTAATATFSGSGSLTATASRRVTLSAAPSGSGTLSAAVSRAVSTSANLTGSGTLTADTASTGAVSASLSGSGTLTSAATARVSTAATLSGSGTLSAAIAAARAVSAAPTGSGSLSATVSGVSRTVSGTATGSGQLVASTAKADEVTADLSGVGSLSATTDRNVTITAAFAGAGSLTALMSPDVRIDADLIGSGSLTATVQPSRAVSAALAGAGDLDATVSSTSFSEVDADLTGSGSLSTTATRRTTITAAFAAAGSLTATTSSEGYTDAAFTGSGILTAQIVPTLTLTADLTGSGELTATSSALTKAETDADLTGSGVLDAVVAAHRSTDADLSGAGTLEVVNVPRQIASGDLAGTGTLTASLVAARSSSALLTGSGTLTADVYTDRIIEAALSGYGELTATVSALGAYRDIHVEWGTLSYRAVGSGGLTYRFINIERS